VPQLAVPAYHFNFAGGLSNGGFVDRRSPAIDQGQQHRIRYRINDLPLVTAMGRSMTPAVADLLDVAFAIYVADRLAPREVEYDFRPVQDRWHRRLRLVVPVRQPERWSRADVAACLDELLFFLSDDDWTIDFVARTHDPRPAEAQEFLLRRSSEPIAASLFSGGLDSLVGQIDLLTRENVAAVAPVTVVTNHRTLATARAVVEAVNQWRSLDHPSVRLARLHVGISGVGRPRDDEEPSQRLRGMLFLAAGVAASALAGVDRLVVCENGVGAISLAMTSDHWGARASKSMHPRTLARFAELASFVLDRSFEIENIGLFATKGELVRRTVTDSFMHAARRTVSCDRASYLQRGETCGKCTSCILRRVALVSADIETGVDGTVRYQCDWFDPKMAWDGERLLHLVAMRDQVERLRDAVAVDDFTDLTSEFPALLDVAGLASTLGLHRSELEHRLVRLYRAHVREFDAFMGRIDRPNWGRQALITPLISSAAAMATG
jgi:hypothetical protein